MSYLRTRVASVIAMLVLAVGGVHAHAYDYTAFGNWAEPLPEPKVYGDAWEYEGGMFPWILRYAPTMHLPLSGSAAWSGTSYGSYFSVVPGSAEVGMYQADVFLAADFRLGLVNGCIGCESGALVTGKQVSGGIVRNIFNEPRDIQVWLNPADIDATGTFDGLIQAVRVDGRVMEWEAGEWNGTFGQTRAWTVPVNAVGAVQVAWEDSDGRSGGASGGFYVERE